MSIGLVIDNIAGSLRQTLPATAEAGEPAGKSASSATAGDLPGSQPVSGAGQLTPGFTVLVLQLLNEQGAVVSTIPTAQQLAAYRNGTASPPA